MLYFFNVIRRKEDGLSVLFLSSGDSFRPGRWRVIGLPPIKNWRCFSGHLTPGVAGTLECHLARVVFPVGIFITGAWNRYDAISDQQDDELTVVRADGRFRKAAGNAPASNSPSTNRVWSCILPLPFWNLLLHHYFRLELRHINLAPNHRGRWPDKGTALFSPCKALLYRVLHISSCFYLYIRRICKVPLIVNHY